MQLTSGYAKPAVFAYASQIRLIMCMFKKKDLIIKIEKVL